jgi:hypothetical protein
MEEGRGFLAILLCQVSFLAAAVLSTGAFAEALYRSQWWEGLAFALACVCLRLSLHHRRLLWLALLLYTLAGTVLVCHLAALLLPDAQGRSALYISAPLLPLSFAVVHLHRARTVRESVLLSAALILFVECASVCILDDRVWDWRYAYACLFTVGGAVYVNAVSTYVLLEKLSAEDAWQGAALVYLQPLLLVEDALRSA